VFALLCQECQKRPATVHLTKIINNEKQVWHLCEQCAREKEEFNFDYPPFSLQSLLSGLLNMETQTEAQPVDYPTTKIQCDNCSLTYTQFRQIGRFGCSNCYTAFSDYLFPLLRRLHGSARHVGKTPKRAGSTVQLRRNLENLRRELQQLVEREEFEKAAQVRDEIRRLEKEVQNGGEDYEAKN
jgi:protein arginine kinase activator